MIQPWLQNERNADRQAAIQVQCMEEWHREDLQVRGAGSVLRCGKEAGRLPVIS